MYVELTERFWSKVDKGDLGECWNFQAYKDKDGYGIFRIGDTTGRAHRLVWEDHYEQAVLKGMYILHMCDNPSCCNPMHLYCGTQSDNMQDMVKRDRVNRNPKPKVDQLHSLSAKHVLMIRSLKKLVTGSEHKKAKYEIPQQKVAEMFGVPQYVISRIWLKDKYPCKEGYYV